MPDIEIMEFPCRCPIKVVGRSEQGFKDVVMEILKPHVPENSLLEVRMQASRKGRYQAVTAIIQADSRAQLDAIYQDLSADPRVLMAL